MSGVGTLTVTGGGDVCGERVANRHGRDGAAGRVQLRRRGLLLRAGRSYSGERGRVHALGDGGDGARLHSPEPGGTLENDAGATIDLQGANDVVAGDSTAVFTNAGTLEKTVGTRTAAISVA